MMSISEPRQEDEVARRASLLLGFRPGRKRLRRLRPAIHAEPALRVSYRV